MRFSLIALLSTLLTSMFAGAAGAKRPTGVRFAASAVGCGTTTPNDSAAFLEAFREVVAGPIVGYRTQSGLPHLPADSVQFGGTGAQCDSVRAHYNALRTNETGIQWSSEPVLMLRVGPSHWVADPKVVDERGQREWIILDSSFVILRVWRTTGHS